MATPGLLAVAPVPLKDGRPQISVGLGEGWRGLGSPHLAGLGLWMVLVSANERCWSL